MDKKVKNLFIKILQKISVPVNNRFDIYHKLLNIQTPKTDFHQ